METTLYIIIGILVAYSIFLNIVICAMRKSLKKRWQKGKLYLSDAGFYCEFNVPEEEIKNSEFITLKVVDTNKKGGTDDGKEIRTET